MNAYELAGLIDLAPTYIQYREECANMLRQQADRIAELEKENSELKYEKSSGVYDAEPVAWISPMTLKNLQTSFLSQVTHKIGIKANTMDEFTIPLYTTPQSQPLSDEEIMEIADSFDEIVPLKDFAKAIEERHGIK